MRSIGILVAATFLSLAHAPFTPAGAASLRICYEPWEPLSYSSGEKADGIAVRFLRTALQRHGVNAQFDEMPFIRCSRNVETGQYDILVLSDNEPRSLQIGPPIAYWEIGIFVHSDSQKQTLSSLDHAHAGLVQGYDYGPTIENLSHRWQVQNTPNALFNLRMVAAKRFDLTLADVPWAKRRIQKEGLSVKLFHPPLLSVPQYTYATPRKPELAAALDTIYRSLILDGVLDRFYRELGAERFEDVRARHATVIALD